MPITVRVEPGVFQAIEALGKRRGVGLGEATRIVLRATLEDEGLIEELSAADQGYNDGLRRGYQAIRVAFQEMMDTVWK